MLLSFFLSLGAQGGVSWWQSRFAEGTLYIRFLIQILSAIEQKTLSHTQSCECTACLIMLVWTVQLLRDGTSFTDGSTAGHIRSKRQKLIPKCVAWGLFWYLGLPQNWETQSALSSHLKLLGVTAARRWPLPKATTMRPLLMPLVNAQNRRTTTPAVKLCWWTYMVPRQMPPGGNWLSIFGHQAV